MDGHSHHHVCMPPNAEMPFDIRLVKEHDWVLSGPFGGGNAASFCRMLANDVCLSRQLTHAQGTLRVETRAVFADMIDCWQKGYDGSKLGLRNGLLCRRGKKKSMFR